MKKEWSYDIYVKKYKDTETHTWFCSFFTKGVLPLIRVCGLGTWSNPHGEPWPVLGWLWAGNTHTNLLQAVGLELGCAFRVDWALTDIWRGLLIFAARGISLFFGNNRLGSLLCVRHNLKSRGLGWHKRQQKGNKKTGHQRKYGHFLLCAWVLGLIS